MGPIYNINTECCELALFLERTSVSKLCKTQIVKECPPIFIRNVHVWIYSTSNLIDINLNCLNQTIPKFRYMSNGTDVIVISIAIQSPFRLYKHI